MSRNDIVEQQSKLIDCLKLLMAVFVVAIHTEPFKGYGILGVYFESFFVRLAVPFFLAITGYLIFNNLKFSDSGLLIWSPENKKSFLDTLRSL